MLILWGWKHEHGWCIYKVSSLMRQGCKVSAAVGINKDKKVRNWVMVECLEARLYVSLYLQFPLRLRCTRNCFYLLDPILPGLTTPQTLLVRFWCNFFITVLMMRGHRFALALPSAIVGIENARMISYWVDPVCRMITFQKIIWHSSIQAKLYLTLAFELWRSYP